MLDWLKKYYSHKHHYLFDLVILILVIILVVLIDFFIASFHSNPGEFKADLPDEENRSIQSSPEKLNEIKVGEAVFLPILDFHHIGDAPANADKITKSYYLTSEQFENNIKALIDNDYRPVFVSEIVDYLSRGVLPDEKIMAITFDDGNEDFYTNAWPILQKYQVKSSMYIMTGVGGSHYLNKDQIIELDKSGLIEFGSHTIYHPKLTQISTTEALKELINSRKYLEDLLDKKINVICYPFGLYNQQIEDLARQAGYQAGLTYDQDAWQNPTDLMALKRISVYPELNIIKFLAKLKKE